MTKETIRLTEEQAKELHEQEKINVIEGGEIKTIHALKLDRTEEVWINGEKFTIINKYKEDDLIAVFPGSISQVFVLITGAPF